MALLAFYDDLFLAHHEWRHPERPERLQAVRRVLRESGVIEQRAEGTALLNRLRRDELDGRFPGLLDSVLSAR